jgi:hypothetical protein
VFELAVNGIKNPLLRKQKGSDDKVSFFSKLVPLEESKGSNNQHEKKVLDHLFIFCFIFFFLFHFSFCCFSNDDAAKA